MLNQSEIEQLEAIVDAHDLVQVLEGLAAVCYLKADHLRSNWQDEPAAKTWRKAARKITTAALRTEALGL